MTKIYIIKYALTKGIFEVNADINNGFATRLVGHMLVSLWPKDYRLTKEEAIKEAEIQRAKKLKQWQRSIERLRDKKILFIDEGLTND